MSVVWIYGFICSKEFVIGYIYYFVIENWQYTIGITITVTVMVAAKLVKCIL